MCIDRILGRPIRPLLSVGFRLFRVALLALVGARFLPERYADVVWVPAFAVCCACLVMFTPYLMAACFCFFAMSQLPIPASVAASSWIGHMMYLAGAGFCLWRTWNLWPKDLPKVRERSPRSKRAPWWGYAFGAVAIVGLFGAMLYVFYFQL
jgi:hypothetical protein